MHFAAHWPLPRQLIIVTSNHRAIIVVFDHHQSSLPVGWSCVHTIEGEKEKLYVTWLSQVKELESPHKRPTPLELHAWCPSPCHHPSPLYQQLFCYLVYHIYSARCLLRSLRDTFGNPMPIFANDRIASEVVKLSEDNLAKLAAKEMNRRELKRAGLTTLVREQRGEILRSRGRLHWQVGLPKICNDFKDI